VRRGRGGAAREGGGPVALQVRCRAIPGLGFRLAVVAAPYSDTLGEINVLQCRHEASQSAGTVIRTRRLHEEHSTR